MGLLQSIKKLFANPKHVVRTDDLEPGEVVVDGAVRVGAAGPLQSPIKSVPCVAFVYSASHRVTGRQAGLTERPLRHVEVFQPFALELEGGRIEAVPRVPGAFAREDHQELASHGYQGFIAAEELVTARARVRVRGVAKRSGDSWVVTYRKIEVLKDSGGKKKSAKRRP